MFCNVNTKMSLTNDNQGLMRCYSTCSILLEKTHSQKPQILPSDIYISYIFSIKIKIFKINQFLKNMF